MKQKLTQLKRELDNSTIIARDFNVSHSLTDRTTRMRAKKRNRRTEHHYKPSKLGDIHKILYLTIAEYKFLSPIDFKCKRNGIIFKNRFSDHKGIKLDINIRMKFAEFANI